MTQSNNSNLLKNEVNNQIFEEKNILKANLQVLSESDQVILSHIEQLVDKKFSELQLRIFKRIDEITSKKAQEPLEVKNIEKNIIVQNKVEDIYDLEEKNYENVSSQIACDICNSKITTIKYSCVLCSEFNMCSKCEPGHSHPTIKFKLGSDISTKQDVYNIFKKFDKEDFPKKELGLFTDIRNSISGTMNFSAVLSVEAYKFLEVRTRPNKSFIIPLLVTNTCKNQIPSNTAVLVRNMYDLKITTQTLNRDLDLKGSLEFLLNCQSSKGPNVYHLEIFLFHKEIEIKNEILRVKVIVNNDMEEEELNTFLVNHPKLLFIPKNQKETLRTIKTDKLSDKDLYVIYSIMEKFNWDINFAIDELIMEY